MPFTLFQLVPWMQIRLAEQRINASRLGSAAFGFRGRARSLYLPYLATLVGTVLLFAAIAGGVWVVIGPWLMPWLHLGGHNPVLAAAMRSALPVIFLGLILFSAGAALVGCWYSAMFTRHIFRNAQLETLRLGSTITGRGLLWLMLGNALIALLTLGLGLPIVVHRSARFLARNLLVAGTLYQAALRQSTLVMPRTGEGMLQMLDHGSMF